MSCLVEQVKVICPRIDKLISALSNASRLIYDAFPNVNWAGFYCADKNGDLYLGPYQGPLACSYIKFDDGICGTCVKVKHSLIIPDVSKEPKHIACSSLTKSEIVVPIIKDERVVAVIDIDSTVLNNFCDDDRKVLEEVADYLKDFFTLQFIK